MPPDDTSYLGKSAYVGDVAANYERDRTGEAIWAAEQEWVDRWIKSLPVGELVLDLPVGTGRFTDLLLRQGLRVHASDISEDMLKIAAQRGAGVTDRFSWSCDDVESLSYPDDEFDNVISWRLFHLLPPQAARRALTELARVCRSRLVIQFFGVEQCPWWREQARKIKRGLLGQRKPSGFIKEDRTPWAHILSYPYTSRGLGRMFSECGLEVLEQDLLGEYEGLPVRVYVLRKRRTQG